MIIFHPSKELLYAISKYMKLRFSMDLERNNAYLRTGMIRDRYLSEKVKTDIKEWLRIISTYYKTSYNAYKIDYDLYEGLYPRYYDEELGCVYFNFDVLRKKPKMEDFFLFNEKS